MTGSNNRLRYLIALKNVSGVGNHLVKKLLDYYGTPENVFGASFQELAGISGISAKTAEKILDGPDLASSDRVILDARNRGYTLICLGDEAYPFLLSQIYDPPAFLYVYGNQDISQPAIAVVGTRNPTRYGIHVAGMLAKSLCEKGIVVTSGMARGIDTVAHQAALEAKGITTAVLGSGLGRVYPPENKGLFHKIGETGAAVSEFFPDTDPEGYHFPLRNRIISGLSLGVVVVEAGKRSGALITARLALEHGREVFAVPGDIRSFKSVGPNQLIREGATPVSSADDILESFPYLDNLLKTREKCDNYPDEESVPEDLNEEERKVYQSLEFRDSHIDEISARLSMETGRLLGILLNLEIKGFAVQTPGKMFQKTR